MPVRTRRRLGLIAAALGLAYLAGGQSARFDIDTRVVAADASMVRASTEIGIAGVSVLVRYTLGD